MSYIVIFLIFETKISGQLKKRVSGNSMIDSPNQAVDVVVRWQAPFIDDNDDRGLRTAKLIEFASMSSIFSTFYQRKNKELRPFSEYGSKQRNALRKSLR